MGAWASVELLQAHPTLFAGALISAGGAGLSVSALEPLLSNNIITFVGEFDTEEVRINVATTQSNWVRRLRSKRWRKSH
jgi:predicted peptidase